MFDIGGGKRGGLFFNGVCVVVLLLSLWLPTGTFAQAISRPSLRAGQLPTELQFDGILDEAAWSAADVIPSLAMYEPIEGGELAGSTTVRVLANARTIVVGVICEDPVGSEIVSFSKARDSELRNEDHVKFILDTFLDGRTGYIFAVNPSGARYDALGDRNGEGESDTVDRDPLQAQVGQCG